MINFTKDTCQKLSHDVSCGDDHLEGSVEPTSFHIRDIGLGGGDPDIKGSDTHDSDDKEAQNEFANALFNGAMDLSEDAKYEEADKFFIEANQALKDEEIDIKKLCLMGTEEELGNTVIAQPAILTISIVLYYLLQKNNIIPDIVAGHSLGEYSALVASSSIKFKDTVKLVRKRGQYMQAATPHGFGSMAAIISFNQYKIEKMINKVSESKAIEIANYNSKYQVVVSGKSEAIENLIISEARDEELNIVPLKVSAPFHSSFMKEAKKKLAYFLEDIDIHNSMSNMKNDKMMDFM